MQETSKHAPEIPYRAELFRKSLHLLAMVIPLGMYYLGKYTALMLLVPICILALSIEIARVRSQVVADLVKRFFGGMMREEEIPKTGSPIALNGATWVLLSAVGLLLIFPIDIAVSAMVMFMISDAAAALVGRRYGRIRWGASKKTLEGSTAFFVVAFLILALFNTLSLPECAGVAAAATMLERTPLPVDDNLHVPLLSGSLIFALLKWVHGWNISLFF